LPRVNINISDEMKLYFELKSKETGVSQSALMVMAIYEYLDQKKAINTLNLLADKMQTLENGQEILDIEKK
jgi:hypothetical protein